MRMPLSAQTALILARRAKRVVKGNAQSLPTGERSALSLTESQAHDLPEARGRKRRAPDSLLAHNRAP